MQFELASRQPGLIMRCGCKSRSGPVLKFISVVISEQRLSWGQPRVDASILESLFSRLVVFRSKYRMRRATGRGTSARPVWTPYAAHGEKQKHPKNIWFQVHPQIACPDPPGFSLQCDLPSRCRDHGVKLPACIYSAGVMPWDEQQHYLGNELEYPLTQSCRLQHSDAFPLDVDLRW